MPTEPALRTELAWKSAALELGLSYTPPALFKPRVMIGEIEGFAVKADVFSAGSGGATFTRIVVKGGPGPQLHLDLIINEENTGTALKKLVVGEDIQTGDADFDRAVNIHGPELEVLALMNREARRALSGLMALGGSVRRGEVFFQVSGVLSDDRKLVDMVRSMVAAARALPALSPDEVSPRLAGIASTDPDVAVRLRALHALERGFAGSDQARRAGERALASADLEERFAGARLVGLDRGGSAFEDLLGLESSATAGAPPGFRARVLDYLASVGGFASGRVSEAVRRCLDDPLPAVRAAALRVVGQTRDPSLCERLCAGEVPRDPAVAKALAWALGRLDTDLAEPALLSLLAHESIEVREEAATSLGAVGTAHAVEPLHELTRGFFGNGQLRSAARKAVTLIQFRLGDVQTGRLSVVQTAPREGALSLAGGGGELAVVADVAGSESQAADGSEPTRSEHFEE
jgi:HEAT repeat protein